MCGRYTLAGKPVDLERHFRAKLQEPVNFEMFNIAPTMLVPVIFDDQQELILPAKWGMRAPWDKTENQSFKPLINLRDDSLMNKPFMRKMLHRKCLVIASGFYEWLAEGKNKTPYDIHPLQQDFFAFAGLWQEEQKADGTIIRSCAIITTLPNETMKKVHNRMPVIISPEAHESWLNASSPAEFFKSYDDNKMKLHPVSKLVNNARNNSAENIQLLPTEN